MPGSWLGQMVRRVRRRSQFGSGVAKSQAEVGRDFDSYAAKWRDNAYALEVKTADGSLIGRDTTAPLSRPGDEWGKQDGLVELYDALFNAYGRDGLTLLEIGSGAGRLTELIARRQGRSIASYFTVDPSTEMTRHLRERTGALGVNFTHVIGGSSSLAGLPRRMVDLAISQSCWSHVSLMDQYLYLRDLRGVMRNGGVFFVNGIFMFGGGLDWCFDRFRRRIHQNEHQVAGVYHEFTAQDAVIELALRLGWEVLVMTAQSFALRWGHDDDSVRYDRWNDVPSGLKEIPRAETMHAYLAARQATLSAERHG